ncbi:hypothetical protein [Streptococcus suis]|uniref:hypothetical protein n=1 Tax=Streptococcus suis TaxID=1307 RepID=UPI001C980492|nr:hypothetical protein [Streptococcus suis]MBY5010318.1 hypothetical protein [Streptococcus suis]MDG4518557.1 hypothetical protein [Streptococcus suis]
MATAAVAVFSATILASSIVKEIFSLVEARVWFSIVVSVTLTDSSEGVSSVFTIVSNVSTFVELDTELPVSELVLFSFTTSKDDADSDSEK